MLGSKRAQSSCCRPVQQPALQLQALRRPASPARLLLVTCSSAGAGASSASAASSNKAKKTGARRAANQVAAPGSPASGASTTAAAAVAATTSSTAASAADVLASLANPPLGFSNNIVPAAPLVVTPGLQRSPADCSSDEELDAPAPPQQQQLGGAPGVHSTGRSAAYRCLVLDSRYLPVNVVSWFRAVVMDEGGKVEVLDYHPGSFAYSAYKAHPLPAVLRVRSFIDVHEYAGRLSLTRKNIMLRDQHRCQYCGCSKDLTLDHVVPVCRGGLNSWTNLVTACMACNQRKGNKSLSQMGWRLPAMPREPTPQEVGVIAGISKADLECPPLPWEPYLATFRAVLEKAQRRAAAAAAASGGWTGGPVGGGSYSSRSSSSSRGGDEELVSVTVHAAGPGSKAVAGAKASRGRHRRL